MISPAHSLSNSWKASSSSGAVRARRRVGEYPCSRMTASTSRRVCVDTSARPLTTFDTVGTETPARRAMCAMVSVLGSPPWLVMVAMRQSLQFSGRQGTRSKVTSPDRRRRLVSRVRPLDTHGQEAWCASPGTARWLLSGPPPARRGWGLNPPAARSS